MFTVLNKLLGREESPLSLDKKVQGSFVLKLNSLTIGHLSCSDGLWKFFYDEDFKRQKDKYHKIVGFPNLNKIYASETLWPFFLIRIPGLRQPLIKEKIKEAKIDPNDELALLKEFGKESISNPYILEFQN